MVYNAFITAGGRISGDFAEKTRTDIKALIQIDGKSLVERAIWALRESKRVHRIALIAPQEVQENFAINGIDDFIPAHSSGVKNILLGLKRFKDDERVILCTSDLPFITPSAVDDFISKCPPDSAVCYPIFEKQEIPPPLRPGISTFLKLQGGEFTGGSLFLLETSPCLARIKEIGRSFKARKNPLGMARILGWKILIKFLLKTCTVEDILQRAEEILEGKCVAVRGCDPAITVDIDDMDSYLFAVEYFSKYLKGNG